MNRENDIKELLSEIDSIIEELSHLYTLAISDESVVHLPKVKVKSAMEHLRSILDYCALDIHVKHYTGKGKIYFPYGKTKELFKKHLKSNFKNMHNKAPHAYEAIESIQPHITNSDWLLALCSAANSNKHNKLSAQTPKKDQVTRIPGFASVHDNAKLIIHGGTVDGVPISNGSSTPVVLTNDSNIEDIKKNLNPNINITRTTESIEFIVDSTNWDALKLIETANNGISDMVAQLYA